MTPHVCRVCFGRVLVRHSTGNLVVHKCSSCGTEVETEHVSGLCACGIRLRNKRDAGIRCMINDRRTPENPAQIIAQQIDASLIGKDQHGVK